jgi:hypothetical protein
LFNRKDLDNGVIALGTEVGVMVVITLHLNTAVGIVVCKSGYPA